MAQRLQCHHQETNYMRNWISMVPLILTAGILLPGCSRSDNRQQSVASASTPVGYAPASAALATNSPASAAATSAPVPEPAASPVENEPAANATVSIPRGTPIHVRLDETVDTHHSRPGDVVHATL